MKDAISRQRAIYIAGFGGKRPTISPRYDILLEQAKASMSKEAFAYIHGGAGSGETMDHNRKAFKKYRIIPRMLRNVEERNTSLSLFGKSYRAPVLLSPVGVLDLAHKDGALAVGKASAAYQIPFIFSNQASFPMEQVAEVMGNGPRWFQLYWSKSDELVKSFLARAKSCGCEAIVLTLDTTMLGWRPWDLDLGYLPFSRAMGIAQYTSDPVFQSFLEDASSKKEIETEKGFSWTKLRNFIRLIRNYDGGGSFTQKFRSKLPIAGVRKFTDSYSRPSISWDELSFIRSNTDLPILLKGILHPGDAQKAIEKGMDGIIVSNHGGRQVNGAIASMEALPGIVEVVNGKLPVLLDSGVREGSDIFKALALGADAVCIGRPYAYALAVAGQKGVEDLLANILADFELCMGLAGYRTLDEINETAICKIDS